MEILPVQINLLCLLVLLVRGNATVTINNNVTLPTGTISRKEHPQNNDDPQEKIIKVRDWTSSSKHCSGLPRFHRSKDVIRLRRRSRRTREYRIITPPDYNSRVPSKVLFYFHGWGEDSASLADDPSWLQQIQRQNYVVVVPEGIEKSWQFPGSSDGRGRDGSSITTCDTQWDEPDYCYSNCPCPTRCGWTHCQDDDLRFVLDLLEDIHDYICVDDARIYAAGISNGAMLTWSMAQDRRIAPLLAGIAPMIGVPHYDYSRGKATSRPLPVIGFYGDYDNVVPPGNFYEDWVEDSGGYYWIPAHRMHTRLARDHGCSIDDKDGPPPYMYYKSDNLQGYSVRCRTHCNNDDTPPFSVDCRVDMGHETPAWMMRMALQFFDHHYEQSQISDRNARGNLAATP